MKKTIWAKTSVQLGILQKSMQENFVSRRSVGGSVALVIKDDGQCL